MTAVNVDNQLYVELEMLNQQLQQLDNNLIMIDEEIVQTTETVDAIDALKTADSNTEVLMPLGKGIFLPVKRGNCPELRVAVGFNVVTDKDFDSTALILRKHIETLKDQRIKTMDAFDQVSQNALSKQKQIEDKF